MSESLSKESSASAGKQLSPSSSHRLNQRPQFVNHEGSQVRSKRGGGPRTRVGKERSRRNAIKHGIFAREVLLPSERSSEFNGLLAGLRKHYKPKGTLENLLVERLAEILWRRCRLIRAEKGEIQKGTESLEIDEKRNQDDEAASILEFYLGFGRNNAKNIHPRFLRVALRNFKS